MVEKSHAHCANVKDTKCCSRAREYGGWWSAVDKKSQRDRPCGVPHSVTLEVARHGVT